jgi:hypothetical protein
LAVTSNASADAELSLRLLVEDVVERHTRDIHAMAEGLRRVSTTARALRVIGVLDGELAADVVAEAELALFVRGAGGLADAVFRPPGEWRPHDHDRGALVSVLAAGDALAEVWTNALTLHLPGGNGWTSPGGVPAGHEHIEVRTSVGVASLDLRRAQPARTIDAVTRPITFVEALVAWAAIAEPALLSPSAPEPHTLVEAWEPVGVVVGNVVVTAVERGSRLHGVLPASGIAWIRSARGVHLLTPADGGAAIEPHLPSRPSPARLSLIDEGIVTEIDLR